MQRDNHFFRQDAGGSNFDHGCATGRSYPDIEIRLVTRNPYKGSGCRNEARLVGPGQATSYFRGGSIGESSARAPMTAMIRRRSKTFSTDVPRT
jgi:hypothetical protein